ncbi:MAG: tRNA (cytidine(34)-2'-O)-methyltransferase [Bdellovibrionales bacterium]|nr:tRNA (cytidine(34)-2'-O)-methyltransferase [Bdellovibrionales bacterium]
MKYPEVLFNVVLIEPEIPQNTGNIGRTCVGAHSVLHLVGPLGFEISDRQLKRAGLDYWPHLEVRRYDNWHSWWSQVTDPSRVFFFTTKTARPVYQARLKPGDWLVFGRETKGLGPEVIEKFSEQTYSIPMRGPIRSLNLATAVAVVLYEGMRQIDTTPAF